MLDRVSRTQDVNYSETSKALQTQDCKCCRKAIAVFLFGVAYNNNVSLWLTETPFDTYAVSSLTGSQMMKMENRPSCGYIFPPTFFNVQLVLWKLNSFFWIIKLFCFVVVVFSAITLQTLTFGFVIFSLDSNMRDAW